MTYTEFRKTFNSKEDFLKALSLLSEDDVRKLIENENTSTTVKAAMITTWSQARMANLECALKNEQTGD